MHLFELSDEMATQALARRMRPYLQAGDVLLLNGPVGVGKSAFARALIQDAMAAEGGAIEPVPSPTFTLVQVYDTPVGSFWHGDLYRLSLVDELAELGFDEAFETAVTLIEWPERLGAQTPTRHLDCHFEHGADEHSRRLTLLPRGDGWDWIADMSRLPATS